MSSNGRILIAEDEPEFAEIFATLLEGDGFLVSGIAATAEDVIEKASLTSPDLVLMDIGLKGQRDGIEAASEIQARFGIPVVYVTGRLDDQTMRRAIATEPFGYLTKPLNIQELHATVELAIRHGKPSHLQEVSFTQSGLANLVGSSRQITRIREQIVELAALDTTILIEGETGTGKELVAQAVHFASRRKEKAFITINCPALTDSLLTSQLFGHRRGAFTGASEDRQGFFEAASGGTIFLDEIASAPLSVQTSLLRVLEEREIIRLGDTKPRKVDVRVLASTNRDLDGEVAKGNFRSDLLYRIRVARIVLPPLHQRREDIPELADLFIRRCGTSIGKLVRGISASALQVLTHYRWPGNVRELRNAIEFAGIRSKGYVIEPEDLPPEVIHAEPEIEPFVDTSNEEERIHSAIVRANGNRTNAAHLLGISRATLYRRLNGQKNT